ncbi:4Fe-4S binding protein [Heliobacterium chlorum]|uniref:4Fe-4S binding protein n=1 Tax=Heliobacterium chlorum TaxID=2698 RepID=A0ABR7SZI9_HELCL|nr:4Fe-4S binding protein [Heliobacterium chlorum]
MLEIDYNKCDRLRGCSAAKACPVQAMLPVGKGFLPWKVERWEFDEQKCIGCNKCVKVCPQKAIIVK